MNSVIVKPSLEPPSQPRDDPKSEAQFKRAHRNIIRSFQMHKAVAISVAVTVFLLLFTFALLRGPNYETSALIYVQPAKARLLADPTGGTYDSSRYDTYIQQQLQTIVRQDILSEALKNAGPKNWILPGELEQSAITRLQKSLKIEREMGSYQLSISLNGSNPVAITKIVNAVAEVYIRRERQDELAQNDQQLDALKNERQRIQAELSTSREEQAHLSSTLGVADTAGETSNPYDSQLAELRTQLAAARAAHAVAEAHYSSINRGEGASEALKSAADDLIAVDTQLSALKLSISQRRSQLASQMSGLTPKNPIYKQDEDELKRLDQSLETITNQLREKASKQLEDKLKLEVTRTANIESLLTNQLIQQTSIATGNTPKLQRAASLAADVTRLQARFTEVDNAISALELEHNATGLVHLLLPADQPLKPSASKKLLILAASLPIGIIFGFLSAYILHSIDPKIYIGEDVNSVLGFPPMAVLPRTDEVDKRVVGDFLLRLAAGVDHAYCVGGARTYVFTSSSSSCDISNLVESLAKKMDQLGYRTMVVKASSALQRFSEGLDKLESKFQGETGLSRTRSVETQLADPRRDSFAAENLERLKQNVDLLFVEALPLLTSAETEFSARLSDVTILIAESAKTTRTEVSNSLELVRRLGVAGVAVVLANLSLQNADEEFIAAVRGVENRQPELDRRDPKIS